MKRLIRSRLLPMLVAGFAVTATLSPVQAGNPAKELWSVDWEPLWPRKLQGVTQSCFPPTVKIATSSTVVAVGVDKSCEPSSTKGTLSPIERPGWLIIFFFDAINGKLLAIREPQLADFNFDLYAIADDHFLLHVRHTSNRGAIQTDSVILISPEGKTLISCELQPAEGDSRRPIWRTFISPSRKTILATQANSRSPHFKVFEADRLRVRADWMGQDADEPIALTISDKEMLGLPQPTRYDRTAFGLQEHSQAAIRAFDGAWRPLFPPSNESPRRSSYAFLGDDAIAIFDNGNLLGGDSFAELSILLPNRQREGPKIIKRSSWNNVWAGARIESSIDGQHFATTVSAVSRFWEALDFYPSHTELYVWNRKDLAPILRIKIDSPHLDFCFLPDGSRLFVLDGKILRSYGLS